MLRNESELSSIAKAVEDLGFNGELVEGNVFSFVKLGSP